MNVHSYADDTQLYAHCSPSDELMISARLVDCIDKIERWMSANRLRLNTDKTQVMWLGTKTQLRKISMKGINIGGSVITPSSTAKNLGVIFDNELTMNPQINAITSSCFYQMRQIRSIRKLLTTDAAKVLVHAFISSRVDYCNSIYYGLTDAAMSKIQSILNSAARLVTDKSRCARTTPILKDLHRLPVRHRIKYKLATIVQNCLQGTCPLYLSSSVETVRSCPGRAHLRSAQCGNLIVPRSRTKRLGPRSFRTSGPTVWNELPPELRSINGELFRAKLKTHYFACCY